MPNLRRHRGLAKMQFLRRANIATMLCYNLKGVKLVQIQHVCQHKRLSRRNYNLDSIYSITKGTGAYNMPMEAASPFCSLLRRIVSLTFLCKRHPVVQISVVELALTLF